MQETNPSKKSMPLYPSKVEVAVQKDGNVLMTFAEHGSPDSFTFLIGKDTVAKLAQALLIDAKTVKH